MLNRSVILSLFSVFMVVSCFAQKTERIRPGIMYNQGQVLESPKYGFRGTIPEGWAGILPQGTEIFFLNKTEGVSGDVLLFARPEGNLETLTSDWEQGMALTENIYLRAGEEISIKDDMAYADVIGEGERINPAYKGFIIARCGEFGPCVTLLMITPNQFYEEVRNEMMEFMRNSEFVEPSSRNPYEDFNWGEFLVNKVLVAYEVYEGGSLQNMIHLCADGTFQTDIRQSGWLKQENKAYLGRNKGTWRVEGNGPESVLYLSFNKKKVPDLKVVMSIRDEQLFAFGERYYAGYSDKCN